MQDKDWDSRIKSELRKGSTFAFKQLYDRFFPGLCVLASRYTGSNETAQEIVQDTFLKIWQMRRDLNIESSIHTYLYSSVRNACINHLKHLLVEQKYTAEVARQLQRSFTYLMISKEDGQSLLISKELEKKIEESIQSLPVKCREIFLLSREEGLKYHEIAEKKKLTVNTVQRQISIALEKLRDMLKEYLIVFIALFSL